jgi:hypothetical protein
MTVFHKTETLVTGDFKRLHTSTSRKMRLTIDTINGEPPNPGGFIPELQGLVGGVLPRVTGGFAISMTTAQCIPIGIIRGKAPGTGPLTLEIAYTVRSGLDA